MRLLNPTYLFILPFFLLCVNAFGQTEDLPVSGSYSGESITAILKSISKNYDVRFAFDGFALRSAKVTISFVEEPLSAVLEKLLTPVNYQYEIIDNTVVISEKSAGSAAAGLPEKELETLLEINLKGDVRDSQSGELLPFATLYTTTSGKSASTDENGRFVLRFIPAANDSLVVLFIGYEQFRISVNKLKNDSFLPVKLRQRRNYLPSVIIEAEGVSLLETSPGASLQTLNPSDLATSQGTGEADIFRAAQLLPGISATQESSSGLYIRGSDSDQTMVNMDGFTVYHLDHFFGAFTAINSNAVKTMRIHKGGLEARYGGRAGGLVEIIGKEGNLYKASAQIDAGPLSAGFCVEAPLDSMHKSSLIITGRRAFTDAIFSPTYKKLFNTAYNASVSTSQDKSIESFGNGADPEYFFQDINAKITIRPTDADVINFSGYASKDKLFVQYADTFQNEIINTLDIKYTDESSWSNKGASARWNHIYSDKWQSTFQTGFSEYLTDYFSLDTIFEVLSNQKKIAFSSDKNRLNDLNTRFEMVGNSGNRQSVFGVNINNVRTSNSTGINSRDEIFLSQKGNTYSLYGQYALSPINKLHLEAGLRINYFDRTNRFYPEPRINASYKLKNNVIWKFSAGRVHQFIHRIRSQTLYINTPDIWRLSDNSSIPVIQSDQILTGVNMKYKKWIFDCEFYLKRFTGNTTFLGVYNSFNNASAATDITDNIARGKGLATGMDLMIQRDFGRHHAWFAYSLMKAESRYVLQDPMRVPETFEQRHELKLYYEAEFEKWDFSILSVYGSGRPYTPLLGTYAINLPDGTETTLPVYGDLNSLRLPAYIRMDVAVSYKFQLGKTKGKIQFSIFNLLNRANVKDIQYLAIVDSNSPAGYRIAERKIYMLGFLPSINLQLKF